MRITVAISGSAWRSQPERVPHAVGSGGLVRPRPRRAPETGPLNLHFVRDIGCAYILTGLALAGTRAQRAGVAGSADRRSVPVAACARSRRRRLLRAGAREPCPHRPRFRVCAGRDRSLACPFVHPHLREYRAPWRGSACTTTSSRRERGAKPTSAPGCPSRSSTRPRCAPDTASELADDLSVALLMTLEQISPLERAAFLLHDVFEMEFGDIAKVLDRSESTAGNWLRAAGPM